uniref:TNFR-Cys domain-containing protein n=1 Tax=Cyprinus carpio TaxID=7962 RepID=A0A8C1XWZ1_CYPCA
GRPPADPEKFPRCISKLYSYLDPVTSKVLLCDQCPPGTAVKRHCSTEEPTVCAPCPEKCFAEQWHWGDSCQHCTSVCKERQIVQRECNSTHDRLCECIPGYHLVVEFCVRHTACSPGFGVIITLNYFKTEILYTEILKYFTFSDHLSPF